MRQGSGQSIDRVIDHCPDPYCAFASDRGEPCNTVLQLAYMLYMQDLKGREREHGEQVRYGSGARRRGESWIPDVMGDGKTIDSKQRSKVECGIPEKR